MSITKSVENNVIEQYNAMRQEYAALSKSKVLFSLFDYEDTYRSIFDNEDNHSMMLCEECYEELQEKSQKKSTNLKHKNDDYDDDDYDDDDYDDDDDFLDD